jgi:hypothetical protein
VSIQITIDLALPSADLITGYGAGAKLYLYSSATQGGSYALVTSTVLISGTEQYEIWDSAGTDTTWYKSRVGDSAGASFSDYSDPFQTSVTPQAGYTNLARVKARLGIDDASDDTTLQDAIDGANGECVEYIGAYLGPSADTVRTYDGRDAVRDQRRLRIKGGIRTLTQVEIAWFTGASFAVATLADFILGPNPQDLEPGQPYLYIDISEVPAGSYPYFPPYINNVRLTGTFSYAASPSTIVEVATDLASRKWQSRKPGAAYAGGGGEFGTTIYPFLTEPQKKVLDHWRKLYDTGIG